MPRTVTQMPSAKPETNPIQKRFMASTLDKANDPATRPTRACDCNRSARAGFAAAHRCSAYSLETKHRLVHCEINTVEVGGG
jgi:hypothetical protein